MSHRVIAGSAKGRQLKLVPGDSTRPIMDRVKESLFNIIGRDIFDAVFCDLFAGTGAVGIEALSRGASHALLVDLDKRAIDTIHENLKITRLAEKATVRRADAFALLAQLPSLPFDIIYVAPPQYKGIWARVLTALDDAPDWTLEDVLIIVQIDPRERVDLPLKHLRLVDERKYGNTLLLFFRSAPARAEEAAED
jgi:16S rRNA (guanine(966)-N(2))-methyltransferase RsmD